MIDGVVLTLLGSVALVVGGLLLLRPPIAERWAENMVRSRLRSFDVISGRAPNWVTRQLFTSTDRRAVESKEWQWSRPFHRFILPIVLLLWGGVAFVGGTGLIIRSI
jgi:hypothetical protein